MGFDDLFRGRRDGHGRDNGYYGGHRDDHHRHHGGMEQYLYLFEKLKNNRKLLVALSIAAVVLVVIVIAVIIMLIPLSIKLFGAIQKSGINGLVEAAKPMLQLLWSGTGK